MSDRLRYGRQTRLPEIGEAGQVRLGSREVTPASSTEEARMIEIAYLRAAGVRIQEGPTSSTSATLPKLEELSLGDPAARAVAEGALRALCTMRALLGVGERAPE